VLQQAIGQRGLAMIDVGDNAEIANMLFIHGAAIIPQTEET
jgi:hypothetical protein